MCTNGWQYLKEGRDPDPAGTSLAAPLHKRGGREVERGGRGRGWAVSSLHVPLGLSIGLGVVIARGFLFPARVGVLVFLVFPLGAGLLGGLSFFALLELTICYITEEKSFG